MQGLQPTGEIWIHMGRFLEAQIATNEIMAAKITMLTSELKETATNPMQCHLWQDKKDHSPSSFNLAYYQYQYELENAVIYILRSLWPKQPTRGWRWDIFWQFLSFLVPHKPVLDENSSIYTKNLFNPHLTQSITRIWKHAYLLFPLYWFLT